MYVNLNKLKMTKYTILFLILASFGLHVFGQDAYLNASAENIEKTYLGGDAYKVKNYTQKFKSEKPKNIILMIGDGMGVSEVFAGLTANHGKLFLDNFKYIGLSKTQASNDFITDSGAGGTAISCGVKTYNGAIGVNADTVAVKSILEEAEEKGLSTGLVSTSAVTHATPASFIAHQPDRGMYEAIAADYLNTDVDVVIGGGVAHFTQRADKRNLLKELQDKGYDVELEMDKISKVKEGKLVGLTAGVHNGRVAQRGDMLPVATKTALNILDNNDKGFFLMIEGSQIDWGGHANSTIYIVEEMLDFDRSIGKALDFAAKDGETLIVVTADHETGGFAVAGGDMKTGLVQGAFTSNSHTGVMVPVFAYGPGAEEFIGIMDNTDLHTKMKELLLGK